MGCAFVCFRYCLVAGVVLLGVSSSPRVHRYGIVLFLVLRSRRLPRAFANGEKPSIWFDPRRRTRPSPSQLSLLLAAPCLRSGSRRCDAIIVINRAAVVRRSRVQCRWGLRSGERRQLVSQFACDGDAGSVRTCVSG